MEKELEEARRRLENLHRRRYQTDSETEQSGYESSGYDETSFRKVYHSSPYQKKFSSTSSQQNQSMMHRVEQQEQQQQHTIESGPSFNESLERFRLATSSGNESDGDFQQTSSVFRSQQQQSSRSIQKTVQ